MTNWNLEKINRYLSSNLENEDVLLLYYDWKDLKRKQSFIQVIERNKQFFLFTKKGKLMKLEDYLSRLNRVQFVKVKKPMYYNGLLLLEKKIVKSSEHFTNREVYNLSLKEFKRYMLKDLPRGINICIRDTKDKTKIDFIINNRGKETFEILCCETKMKNSRSESYFYLLNKAKKIKLEYKLTLGNEDVFVYSTKIKNKSLKLMINEINIMKEKIIE